MTAAQTDWPHSDSEMAAHIRAFDWASTPLGPIAGWPQSLKTIVDLMLRSSSMMSLVWGAEAIHLYNDRFTELLREHRLLSLGKSAYDTFARSRDVFADDIANGMAGRSKRLIDQRYPVFRNGHLGDAWFDVEYAPVHDEAGRVAGVLWTLQETTTQHRTQHALCASEERCRLLIESWAQAVWETDADGVVIADSPSWRAYTGQTPEEWLGYGWLNAIHPDDRAYAERQWREAMAARKTVNAEFRLCALGGGWRWTNVRAAPILNAGGQIEKWVGMNIDVDARKRTEAALRQSEEHLAAIFGCAAVGLSELALSGRFLRVNDELCRILGRSRQELLQLSIADVTFPEDLPPSLGAVETALRDDSTASLDKRYLRPDGSIVWANSALRSLHHGAGQPNTLLAVTGDLTERRAADERLRESEERFRQFANAASGALWVRDASTLQMEYVSPAVARIYGIEPDAFLNAADLWLAAIVPEDREAARKLQEQARRGEAVVHEFRIRRFSDDSFRWIRNTGFPLFDTHGRVQRIGGISEDVTEAKLATEHTGVLLAELQHRVRNIMGMIRSMANRTAGGASGIEDHRSLLEGRLLSLARVQALLTREANAGGSLRDIIASEVAAQVDRSSQVALTGPDITLSPKAVEVLSLAFHELATNALKYGAFSVPNGRLRVDWFCTERRGAPWLILDWIEEGAPLREPSTRRGFGSELIEERIPYELGGRGEISISPGGARCHLEFPLRDGESILETDAPRPTTVFGGTLDMAGAPDLTGRTVLVVEDDYFLASDTVAALRGAGARVLGPCPTAEAARDLLRSELPSHAVLDLNLGGGARFDIARLLKSRGVPFIFLTGYDQDVIPDDVADVIRLQKPVPFLAIIEAIARL